MADGVQIYGAFDVGVLVRGGSDAGVTSGSGTETQVRSGMNGHNGIGFRMSEDLGNGMKISGDAMFGFALDASGGALRTADGNFHTIYSYLALSGDFGTLIAGRAGGARAGWIKKYDPFGGFGVANALSVHDSGAGNADYADNVLAWVTPEVLPGLKGLFAYTTNLVGQDSQQRGANSTPLYAVAAMYDSGPLSFVVNYEHLWNYRGFGNSRSGENTEVITVGGSYDFGVIKLYGLWDQLTNQTNGFQVGLSAPVTEALVLKAGYAKSNRRGNAGSNDAECDKFGVGAVYSMSKRTSLYADAAVLDSDRGSNCAGRGGINTNGGTFSNGLLGQGSLDGFSGYGEWGTNVGVRHTF